MEDLVTKRVNEILKEEGLEGIFILKTCRDELNYYKRIKYETPLNDKYIYINYQIGLNDTSGEMLKKRDDKIQTVLDFLKLEHHFNLQHFDKLIYGCIVNENGRLKECGKLLEYSDELLFSGLSFETGSDFEPLFKKMLEIYKRDYDKSKLAEVIKI